MEPLEISDGMLTLNRAAGLGIKLNESLIEQYRLSDPLNLPDGSYSDMVFVKAPLNPP